MENSKETADQLTNMQQSYKNYKKAIIVDSPNSLNNKVSIVKSKRIDTLAFLPHVKDSKFPDISRLFAPISDIQDAVSNGVFSLNSNDLFFVSFKV